MSFGSPPEAELDTDVHFHGALEVNPEGNFWRPSSPDVYNLSVGAFDSDGK